MQMCALRVTYGLRSSMPGLHLYNKYGRIN